MANTKEQQLAIDTDGSNIIVSAGAGSGKTAVLTQRVIRKILDGVDVDRLLVLTFTNEAASEMKSRIRDAIIKNNLDKQLGLLDSAYITTFDSFALSLVKKYAYLLNISSDIRIVDSNIISIYKYKTIDKIFEEMYGDSGFDKLVSDFCLKDDRGLKDEIINLSNKLDLQLDKKIYLDNYINDYCNDLFVEKMIDEYDKLIKKKINELSMIYEEFTTYISDSLINKLDNYFKNLFNGSKYDEYVLFKSMSSVRFMGVSEDGLKIKDLVKDKIDEIKEMLKYKDTEEIRESIKSTYHYIEVIIEIIRRLEQVVNEYKYENNVFEFNDIAHLAIEIVRDNLEIREEVRNYFNEIMVDEYQDTSNLQEEFINLICNDNVYMVGDVKQSIYRFRNANPYIFQDKYNRYSNGDGGIKIDLLKNFRSRSETLFNINEIFNLIMDDEIGNADYIVSHNMMYGNTMYDLEDTHENNKLEIYNYDKETDLDFTCEEKELFIISDDINEKIKNKYQVFDKKTGKLRDIRYSDICIITDRNKYLNQYKKILEYNGIPSVIYMDLVLTNDVVIMILKNLISLVDYVNRGVFDNKFRYLFTSVARSFLFNYSDKKIYDIISEKKMLSDEIVSRCREIELYCPLVNIINSIIDKFGVYEKLTNLHDIDEDLIRISNLIDIANNLSGLGYGLSEFVLYIEDVIDRGLPIKYSVNTNAGDSVKMMNIHKSKGLEFSLCYFTGMHNKFTIKELNDKMLLSDKLGIILPYVNKENKQESTIAKALYVDNFFREEVSEKIRLFYVALTRCREKMIIVTSLKEDRDGYESLVPSANRIKYRSFLDILNSISVIDKYVVDKMAKYTHEYDFVKLREMNKDKSDVVIENKKINIDYELTSKKHFSKEHVGLFDNESIKAMEYGTMVHEKLEYADFRNPNNKFVANLLKHVDNNFINVYREYEFKYSSSNVDYHGIIDLMLEYDDYIKIIDYKLKNIEDENYIKQLNGYKTYIEEISNKKVSIYLYSVMDDELKMIG